MQLGATVRACSVAGAVLVGVATTPTPASATMITYQTPTGSARATFRTGWLGPVRVLEIFIGNLQADTGPSETLSGLTFAIANGVLPSMRFNPEEQPYVVLDLDGKIVDMGFGAGSPWDYSLLSPTAARFAWDGRDFGHLVIGPPGIGPPSLGGVYTDPILPRLSRYYHFLSVYEVIMAPNISDETVVTSATFHFGPQGSPVEGVVVPEPSSLVTALLGGGGLLGYAALRRRAARLPGVNRGEDV